MGRNNHMCNYLKVMLARQIIRFSPSGKEDFPIGMASLRIPCGAE